MERGGSAVKSSSCSSRRPGFNFQHHITICDSTLPTFVGSRHTWFTDIQRQNTHTQKLVLKEFQIEEMSPCSPPPTLVSVLVTKGFRLYVGATCILFIYCLPMYKLAFTSTSPSVYLLHWRLDSSALFCTGVWGRLAQW